MIRWTGRLALAGLVVTLTVLYVKHRYHEYLWETCYCFEEDRYVPHDEMVRRIAKTMAGAINRELDRRDDLVRPSSVPKDITLPRYEDEWDFLRTNPGGIRYSRERAPSEWEYAENSPDARRMYPEFSMFTTIYHRSQRDLDLPDLVSRVRPNSCGWGYNRGKHDCSESGCLSLRLTSPTEPRLRHLLW